MNASASDRDVFTPNMAADTSALQRNRLRKIEADMCLCSDVVVVVYDHDERCFDVVDDWFGHGGFHDGAESDVGR